MTATGFNPYKNSIKSLDDIANLSDYGKAAVRVLREHMTCDAAHDEGHIVRVVRNALWFGIEDGSENIIIASAVLHDLVNIPKDHPNRRLASSLSADQATTKLWELDFGMSQDDLFQIHHAIVAHSWSANVEPQSIEAMAVQDADRIDALGYIGIARLFSTGGSMGRMMFHPTDPYARNREMDESTYALDHYFVKLGTVHLTMKTVRGRAEATKLKIKMANFIDGMIHET